MYVSKAGYGGVGSHTNQKFILVSLNIIITTLKYDIIKVFLWEYQ